MMLRIHLTSTDLGRVEISGPDMMTELVTSAQMLTQGLLGPRYAGLGRDVPTAARPLLQLVERPDSCPDFLTPGGSLDFRSALDAVLATPTPQLRRELASYHDHTWTHEPASVRRALAGAIDSYYRQAFRARWHDVAAIASSDQALRAHTLARHGLDGLLNDIYPTISWRSPTLIITCEYARGLQYDLDLHLRGRGLRVVPVTAIDRPYLLDRPGAPYEILYPARASASRRHTPDALGTLLGRTRFLILSCVGAGATTTQLATRVGVSMPSASEHATVLRKTGLIVSDRVGGAVVHRITALGTALLGRDS